MIMCNGMSKERSRIVNLDVFLLSLKIYDKIVPRRLFLEEIKLFR